MAGWVGRRLGKVDVELLLARGGVAEVYLGRHTTLQRAVAVKVLNAQYADDADLLERFRREARVVAMLRHPNIVQVHDFDSVDGYPYLIMEYVPGITLAAYMRSLDSSGGRMQLDIVGRLLSAVAAALQYAHGRGVIHRDVKPANILLTSASAPVAPARPLPTDFQPVLSDFGLGRFVASTQSTAQGLVAGTPAYMSPEQAAGTPLDARTDVYSMGIVLYELLAGRVPFEADSALTVLNMHIHQAPAKIPDLPEGLQAVLDRALEKDPTRRYASPSELASAFEAARLAAAERPEARDRLELETGAPRTDASPGNLRGRLWTYMAGLVVVALALVLGIRSLISPPAASGNVLPTAMQPPTQPVMGPVADDPVGVLRFQDGAALVDEVSFNASAMAPPAPGGQYEVWLLAESGEERRSVGYLAPDADGKGTTAFVDPQGRNLLAAYNGVEITLEPSPDQNPNPSGDVAFSASLPAEGLLHVRHLLASFSKAPDGSGLVVGLLRDAQLLSETSKSMLALYESGDELGTRLQAEAALNMLVGSQSPDYLDWNGDGKIEDPGDGYGLLLNGDNAGYIQGSYAHAEFAAASPGATDNMQSHGEHVVISARNLEAWAPQLRDLMKQVLASRFDATMGGLIRQAVALSDNMLLGTDLNGNERIEAISGEGGAQTAYQHALYMADMVVTLPDKE